MRWLLLATLIALIPSHSQAQSTRRFALLAGANHGGADRVALRYALTDVQALSGVLLQLGGVRASDQLVLKEPSAAAFQAGFAKMAGKLEAAKAAGQRVELVFYYSGHSDERGLMLGEERVGYHELRSAIDALPADVRVAIVDACASGVLTRGKGGRHRPGFLLDESTQVKGYAILTSASADEAAQESDRVGGSFFTHYLLSGLRGAADASGDGRVTLNEAYQFAYNETLARTEQTRIGAQHPNYDLQLSGQGDVVLTDVNTSGAGLVLTKALHGRIYLRDVEGRLVAELAKPAGRAISLGFGAGEYRITLAQEGQLSRARLTLETGAKVSLGPNDFQAIEGELTMARGGSAEPPAAQIEVERRPIVVTVPGVTDKPKRRTEDNAALHLLIGEGYRLHGAEIGVVGAIREDTVRGAQISGVFNEVGGALRGAQISGVFNRAKSAARGLQVTGVFNEAHTLDGAQVAGVFNEVEDMKGLQVAGIFNSAERIRKGMQAAGIFNSTQHEMQGLQVASIFNANETYLRGWQMAGVINFAKELRGVQVGTINVAGRVKGAQFGVINIANHVDGVPFGLINLIEDGIHSVEIWGSDVAPTNIALKLGSHWFYTLLTANAGYLDGQFSLGFGFGGRIKLSKKLELDIDKIGYWFHNLERDFMVDRLIRLRGVLGYRISEKVRIFGGLAGNLLVSKTRNSDDLYRLGGRWEQNVQGVNLALWPGALAGVSFF